MSLLGKNGAQMMELTTAASTGVVAGILAFIGSVITAVVVIWSTRSAAKSTESIEELKFRFTQQQLFIEHKLRGIEALTSLNSGRLHREVQSSQLLLRNVIEHFETLLNGATTADNDAFLVSFARTMSVVKDFADSCDVLTKLVRTRDSQFLKRIQRQLTQFLIGMRLDKNSRRDPDFGIQLDEYRASLRAIESVANAKCRRYFNP